MPVPHPVPVAPGDQLRRRAAAAAGPRHRRGPRGHRVACHWAEQIERGEIRRTRSPRWSSRSTPAEDPFIGPASVTEALTARLRLPSSPQSFRHARSGTFRSAPGVRCRLGRRAGKLGRGCSEPDAGAVAASGVRSPRHRAGNHNGAMSRLLSDDEVDHPARRPARVEARGRRHRRDGGGAGLPGRDPHRRRGGRRGRADEPPPGHRHPLAHDPVAAVDPRRRRPHPARHRAGAPHLRRGARAKGRPSVAERPPATTPEPRRGARQSSPGG